VREARFGLPEIIKDFTIDNADNPMRLVREAHLKI